MGRGRGRSASGRTAVRSAGGGPSPAAVAAAAQWQPTSPLCSDELAILLTPDGVGSVPTAAASVPPAVGISGASGIQYQTFDHPTLGPSFVPVPATTNDDADERRSE